MTQFDKAIGIIGEIFGYNYNLYSEIMKHHKEKPLKYTSKWYNLKSHYADIPNPILGEECTYDMCIEWIIKKGREVEVTVFDGDFLDGSKTEARCTFNIKNVPHKLLKGYVESKMRKKAKQLESKEEDERRENRREEIYQEFIVKIKDNVK